MTNAQERFNALTDKDALVGRENLSVVLGYESVSDLTNLQNRDVSTREKREAGRVGFQNLLPVIPYRDTKVYKSELGNLIYFHEKAPPAAVSFLLERYDDVHLENAEHLLGAFAIWIFRQGGGPSAKGRSWFHEQVVVYCYNFFVDFTKYDGHATLQAIVKEYFERVTGIKQSTLLFCSKLEEAVASQIKSSCPYYQDGGSVLPTPVVLELTKVVNQFLLQEFPGFSTHYHPHGDTAMEAEFYREHVGKKKVTATCTGVLADPQDEYSDITTIWKEEVEHLPTNDPFSGKPIFDKASAVDTNPFLHQKYKPSEYTISAPIASYKRSHDAVLNFEKQIKEKIKCMRET